jgi:hypothetical protein
MNAIDTEQIERAPHRNTRPHRWHLNVNGRRRRSRLNSFGYGIVPVWPQRHRFN